MTQIGLIGCGMWGRNLARNLASLGVLAAVADRNEERATAFATEVNTDATTVDDLITTVSLDGIVIATAAPTHCDLAVRALSARRHVYIEKPLALTLSDAQQIGAAATRAGRQVMVGHLIRYHDAFRELQSLVASGAIGSVRHVTANRLAMGRIRATESVLFDLCPHDLSLILALMGDQPLDVSCHGASHVTPGIVDTLSTFLAFPGGRSASLNTSWISPYKEHRLVVSGSQGALVFDDTMPWDAKLTLYRDSISADGDNFAIDRAAPETIPVAESEPLKQEMQAFTACCASGKPAPSDIEEALGVQRVLEQMQSILMDHGMIARADISPHAERA